MLVAPYASHSLAFCVAVLLAPAAARGIAQRVAELLRGALLQDATRATPMLLIENVLVLSCPLLIAIAATSALVSIVQSGSLFAPRRVMPDLGRLNPFDGLGALLTPYRLWIAARATLGTLAAGWLVVDSIREHLPDLGRAYGSPAAILAVAGATAYQMAGRAAALTIVLALADWSVSRRAFVARLKMSRSEVERERRENEANPQYKDAGQRAHRELLAIGMADAIRDATVVITYPPHLAKALRYVEGQDEVPIVVAHAAGDLALRTENAARALGIPIVQDDWIAQRLAALAVGDPIPETLYAPVARILRELEEVSKGPTKGPSRRVPI